MEVVEGNKNRNRNRENKNKNALWTKRQRVNRPHMVHLFRPFLDRLAMTLERVFLILRFRTWVEIFYCDSAFN